jgi:UDP-glucose 4-epimerase
MNTATPPFSHVLVTGGAGFIGSHLARRLVGMGLQVTVADNLCNGFAENVPPEASLVQVDLTREDAMDRLAAIPFDAVMHLAAQSSGDASFDDPLVDMRSHIHATLLLLRLCRDKGVRRFLYASSSTIYGAAPKLPVDETCPPAPKTFYAAGKIGAEAYVNLFATLGLATTIFRMPNVYGPGQNLENKNQGMISIYLAYLLEDQPILVKGPRERFRDFIHVADVAQAWTEALATSAAHGKTYNLGSGVSATVGEVVDQLRQTFGRPEHPVTWAGGTRGDQTGMVLDTARIRQDLRLPPCLSLKEGIEDMVAQEKRRLSLD